MSRSPNPIRTAALLAAAWLAAAPLAAGSLEVTAAAALGGSLGLEVVLGGPCSPNELVVPGPTASGDYTVCLDITAAGVEIVGAGATFTASRRIALGDGFAVGPGVDFTAIIDEQVYPYAFVVDSTPSDLATYGVVFQIDLDGLTLGPDDELHTLAGIAADGTVLFRIVLLRNAALGENRLVLHARLDDGSYAETPPGEQLLVPAGSSTIELSWKADDGDGHLLVALNGMPLVGLAGLDNGDGRLDAVDWGAVWGEVAATTGSLYLDEYDSVQ